MVYSWEEKMANREINKVILVGNLLQVPKIRYMPIDCNFANFNIVTSK